MTSYTVQVHLYGPVAVVTLCASADRSGSAGSVEDLPGALAGLGAGTASVVLDLDRAPDPAPARVLAAVEAWVTGRDVTVVVLAPGPVPGSGRGRHHVGVPVLRMGWAGGLPGSGDEAASAVRLRRGVAGRALAQQAAGIRQARHRAHPCS
ncbi:hypothetical protein ACIQUQ_19045 [Streptomyces sp. NPDC101118]|uniref:hypothetical protein n=1 Tax=Streptomyces sp. NPDC101118 TaxID=3366109 RepID=UPI00382CA366